MSDENLNSVAAPEAAPQAAVPQSFVDSLPADLRDNPSLKSFKSVDDLAKSYVHANSRLGNSIRIPTKEAGAEQMNEFYSKLESIPDVVRLDPNNPAAVYDKLGRPESPDKYTINPKEEWSELVNETALNDFKVKAHELGLNNKQAEELINYQLGMAAKQVEAHNQSYMMGQEVLKQTWGPQYEARLNAAKETVQVLSQKYPGLQKLVNVPEFANDPDVIRLIYDMGVSVKEDKSVMGVVRPQFGTSPEEAANKIQDIRNNAQHPYNLGNHPGHKAAVEEMNRLYEIKNGMY